MAMTIKVLAQSLSLAGSVIGACAELSWPRPTRPTDVVHVRSKMANIKSSRSKPDCDIVPIHALTVNHDDEVRQDFTVKRLAFKKREQ